MVGALAGASVTLVVIRQEEATLHEEVFTINLAASYGDFCVVCVPVCHDATIEQRA